MTLARNSEDTQEVFAFTFTLTALPSFACPLYFASHGFRFAPSLPPSQPVTAACFFT